VKGCFPQGMRIFWDERRIEGLEKKVDRLEGKIDDGFTAVRSEHRADFRMLLGVLMAMFMTMILGFAGLIVGIITQAG
jgi:hypothetical protein